MKRAESYYREIRTICSEHGRCRGLKASGKILHVTLSPDSGIASLWFDFFADTVIAFVRHSCKVAPEYYETARVWLNEYNMYHDNDAYGISRDGYLTFFAGYDLRYRSPQNDPGLDGFCTLLLDTVPGRLGRLADLLAGAAADNIPSGHRSVYSGAGTRN